MSENGLKLEQRAAQSQRRVLGKQETGMGAFQRRVETLLGNMPIGIAQTEAGIKLMEALQEVDDTLALFRSAIRGEIRPAVQKKSAATK